MMPPDWTSESIDNVAVRSFEEAVADYLTGVGQGYGHYWSGLIVVPSRNASVVWLDELRRLGISSQAWLNSDRYAWRLPTGEQLAVAACRDEDDYWNFHGHEYPWLCLAHGLDVEVAERLKVCCRSCHEIDCRLVTVNPYGE